MALKPRYKRRIIWTIVTVVATLLLAMVIVPPMFTLNRFKPQFEQAVFEQTQVPAKLNGNIHFSLLGGATIVAHDVVIPSGKIGSVMFHIPFSSIFDFNDVKIKSVAIYNADVAVDELAPAEFNHNIGIFDTNLNLMGFNLRIINAEFIDGQFNGVVRTKSHKYDVRFVGDTFYVKNNQMDLRGQMFSDGVVRGHIDLVTDDINSWFGFEKPKIDNEIAVSMDYQWDGGKGFSFTNIQSDDFSGNIELLPNGDKIIQLVSDNMNYDFSFLVHPSGVLNNTKINLDFYGNLKFSGREFKHLKINAIGTDDRLQIGTIVADDFAVNGGYIDSNGAHDIMITAPFNGGGASCLFSGTPSKWQCSEFSYDDIYGAIFVNGDQFDITVYSDKSMPNVDSLLAHARQFAKTGTITFKFADASGVYNVGVDSETVSYNYVQNKTLKWMGIDFDFLPEFMMTDTGDVSVENGMMKFVPYNNQWSMSKYDDYFYITGKSFKAWLPGVDLQSLNDAEFSISGIYNDGNISNLNIKVAGHEFVGSVSGKNITLKTELLNIDTFMNQVFFDRFAELEFLTNSPILVPFSMPVNISLSADSIIYNGDEFKNFVYSLKSDSQTFSIMDSARGNALVTIDKDKSNYDIFVQLNKFVINGNLLASDMPLNIRDTMITAEIALSTSGKIAHDIYYNMSGTVDLSFDGGVLYGMAFDSFYASAENVTVLNAEYALANALTGGETQIKTMRVVGNYKNGDFVTTQPLTFSMRHVDARGGLSITDGQMTAELDLVMRGTSPQPKIIQMSVLPDGGRNYSLSEIMIGFDPGFLRAFVKTHNKF